MHRFPAAMLVVCALAFASSSRSEPPQAAAVRILVAKPPVFDVAGNVSFRPIPPAALRASGFVLLADYNARAVVLGPSHNGASLIDTLSHSGYPASVASDLDAVEFHGYSVDPDTGRVTPGPADGGAVPADRAVSVVVFTSYPLPEWIAAVRALGMTIVEPLPPAAYVVYGPATALAALRSQTFVRAVSPLTPAMKRFGGDSAVGSGPSDRWSIEAIEAPEGPLGAYLTGLSTEPVVENRTAASHVTYEAQLTDLDAENLAHWSNVYGIARLPGNAPSSERQAMIVLQPTVNPTTGALTLPAACGNYAAILSQQKQITNFSNTKVAMLDTGFDDGTGTHPDFNFNGSFIDSLLTEWPANGAYDDVSHGTFTASVISGFAPFGQRSDSGNYRYGLGLGETVKLVSDKFFKCDASQFVGGSLSSALTARIAPRGANVVNLSFNDEASCQYTADSITVDNKTRQPWLFTISAGNVISGCANVRSPATAKNSLSVGATSSFTLNWPNETSGRVAECAWDGAPQVQDARNIPSFSPKSLAGNVMKPDLVAPGLRMTGPVTRASGVPPFCNGTPAGAQHGIFCNDNVDQQGGVTYALSAGTSFSAPAVAGAAAVVRKWYRNKLLVDPSPAMTKAMLINGARDIAGAQVVRANGTAVATLQHVYFDPYQGWGMLNLSRLLGPASTFWASDQAATLTDFGLWQGPALKVVDGNKDTRVTLVWSDAHGAAGPGYKVVNDLFLQVDSVFDCPCWYGNVFNASSGASIKDPSGFVEDTTNNVEQVIIPKGTVATGDPIRVNVIARNLMADGIVPDGASQRQDFAVFVDNAH